MPIVGGKKSFLSFQHLDIYMGVKIISSNSTLDNRRIRGLNALGEKVTGDRSMFIKDK